MKLINLLVIGVGFHARRIYIPALMEFSANYPVRLVGGIDLKDQQRDIEAYLRQRKFPLEMIYTDEFDPERGLPRALLRRLDEYIKTKQIKGIVISTEPLAHKVYAEWALRRNLHILMDKPISTRTSINENGKQAIGLLKDYRRLLALYKRSQQTTQTIFSINLQRRYEYGFDKVIQLVKEAKDRFNVPVTSIQAMHADGTWVLPAELLTQKSHPYFYGYGKCSHSGFHIFDMSWQIYEAGLIGAKSPDRLQVFSSFLGPTGFATQIDESDYREYFGSLCQDIGLSWARYRQVVRRYGEIDSFSILRLLRGRENICNISINLLHNSFSRRAWPVAKRDLYKGNGRVKHQQFTVQQGPFQCIQVHNYQSEDKHDTDNLDEYGVGGNNHFDIYVFRNSRMFGYGKPFQIISAKDLEKERDSGLVNEKAKYRVVLEFIQFLLGRISKESLRSSIETQSVAVKIMSGVYQSHVRLSRGLNPLISMRL